MKFKKRTLQIIILIGALIPVGWFQYHGCIGPLTMQTTQCKNLDITWVIFWLITLLLFIFNSASLIKKDE